MPSHPKRTPARPPRPKQSSYKKGYNKDYLESREQVITEAMGRCQGKNCIAWGKQCHHIRPLMDETNNDPSNLIWFCDNCHGKAHGYRI